jgi:tetratricopeptide (TPR) repeat protein
LGGTDNLEAYELYLIAQGKFQNDVGYTGRAPASVDDAIALDPEFALAWAFKALLHYYLLVFGPISRAEAEQDAALSAALKAIELEPSLADGYNSLGYIQTSRGEFNEAESSYNKGLQLANDTYKLIYYHYFAVGYFDKSLEVLEKMVREDALNQELRGNYLSALGLLGNMQRAEEEYARGRALFGDKWWVWGYINMTYLRLGTDHSISRDGIVRGGSIFDAVVEHHESPEDGLVELHRLYGDIEASKDFFDISIFAAYFGDLEFSMDAMEKGLSINSFGLRHVWYPIMKGVRQTPRFKKIIKEIRLVDYWKEYGWPDLCRPVGDDDFVCD